MGQRLQHSNARVHDEVSTLSRVDELPNGGLPMLRLLFGIWIAS